VSLQQSLMFLPPSLNRDLGLYLQDDRSLSVPSSTPLVTTARADSIREYLTGATADGLLQDQPNLSTGNYRSAMEAFVYGIFIGVPYLQGAVIEAASAGNTPGTGVLSSPDGLSLQWYPPGSAVPGPLCSFANAIGSQIVEGPNPSQFLRVFGNLPFATNGSPITLTVLLNNVFGFPNVPDALATSGESQYRATILVNQSQSDVTFYSRWLALFGTPQISNVAFLSASGAGIIQTTGVFTDWPTSGWCKITRSNGFPRESVYYTSRTSQTLTVPAAGRGQFGSTIQSGNITDFLYPIPGIAIGWDPTRAQPVGSAIQGAPPTGVIWNQGISQATGIQVPILHPGQQIGFWMWRQIPPGAICCPNVFNEINTSFYA
jgi:hypothetical protein